MLSPSSLIDIAVGAGALVQRWLHTATEENGDNQHAEWDEGTLQPVNTQRHTPMDNLLGAILLVDNRFWCYKVEKEAKEEAKPFSIEYNS